MQAVSGEVSPRLLSEIRVHGILLWASLGFLMPVGVLVIRTSHREKRPRCLGSIFRVHAVLQIVSAILVTAAAVMSIKNFDNSFNNFHQMIGIVVYGLVWLQALIGVLRPRRKQREETMVYLHWALGITLSLLGVINTCTGLIAYRNKTSRRIKLWLVLFTAEIFSTTVLYLLQDKWTYIQQQGAISRHREPVMPVNVDPTTRIITDDKPKEVLV